MTEINEFTFMSTSPDETNQLAARLATLLEAGDVLLLGCSWPARFA